MMKLKKLSKLLVPIAVFRFLRFRSEGYLWEIGPDELSSKRKSILFFTTHKCASTFTPKVLLEVARQRRLKTINLTGFLWHTTNEEVYDALSEREGQVFSPRGYCYSPLRKFVSISDIEAYSSLLILRDPRDVLVSGYFSMVKTHELPLHPIRRRRFLEERRQISRLSIDEYAIEYADQLGERYRELLSNVLACKDSKFLTYESMITDFQRWIGDLEGFFGVQFKPEQKEGWAREVSPPLGEHMKHRRKVTPGDYMHKLAPETIEILDSKFDDLLSHFSY